MADTHKSTKAGGLTRGKAILIAVLAVVLLGVLYLQFGESGGSGRKLANAARRRPAVVTPPSAKSAAEKKPPTENTATQAVMVVVDKSRWKSPAVGDVAKYDPFALPASFPQPAMAETPNGTGMNLAASATAAEAAARKLEAIQKLWTQWEDLKRSPVRVIVRGRDEYAAMIGDRTLHVGDEIYGFTVTNIDTTGVQVERKPDP